MAIKTFSINEALLFGWNVMKKNIGFFIGILVVVFIASAAPDVINNFIKGKAPVAISIIIAVIFWVLQLILGMGLIKIALKFCGNEKPDFAVLFSGIPLFFKYLAGVILYVLIVLGGLILLIVPGVIWSIKFQYFPYLIIDKNMGPIEALKKSASITHGAKWDLLGFNVVLAVVNVLGILCLLIGAFAAVPTVMIAYAFVYRKLLAQTEAVSTPAV
ncbi:MAG: hypothetical protein ABH836_05015 [Candidatus Omnitrophota bacterium]